MEDQHFLDQENLKIENERPTFITVLCIITFIVSGFMLIYSLFTLVTYDVENQKEAVELLIASYEENGNEALGEMTNAMQIITEEEIENHSVLTVISFASIILSLLGSFMMFNLKRFGFHLYLGSKVIAFTPLLIFTLSSAIVIFYTVTVFFMLAFIIMYAVNLKFMK